MSIKFRLNKRVVQLGKHKGKEMTFAQSVTSKKISFHRFCEEVSDGSTVGTADVKAVIDRMVYVLRRHMEDGESVEVGDLGTFSPTFGSDPVEEGERFDANKHIRDPKISFRAKPAFKSLSHVRFEQISAEEAAARDALTAKKKAGKSTTPSSSPGSSSSSAPAGTGGSL